MGIKLPGLNFNNQLVEAAYRKELVFGEDHPDRAQPGRGDGEDAGARAHVQHAVEPAALEQGVIGQQAAHRGAMVSGAKRRPGLNPQVDRVGRREASVVGAEDEEASGPHWRQARQGHGQPVGVGQHLGGDGQPTVILKHLTQGVSLGLFGGEGVDTPDVAVLVLLQDGVGDGLQARMGVDGLGGGLGDLSRSPGDDLNSIVRHAPPLEAQRPNGEG